MITTEPFIFLVLETSHFHPHTLKMRLEASCGHTCTHKVMNLMLSLSLLVTKETTSFDGATAHWQAVSCDQPSPVPLEAPPTEEVLSHRLRAVEGLDRSHKVSWHIGCGWMSCDGHVTSCDGHVTSSAGHGGPAE